MHDDLAMWLTVMTTFFRFASVFKKSICKHHFRDTSEVQLVEQFYSYFFVFFCLEF